LFAVVASTRNLIERAGVREDVSQRQRRITLRRNLQTLEMEVEVVVELDASVSDQLQSAHRCYGLRDGRDRPHSPLRIDLRFGHDIGNAVTTLINHAAVADKDERGAGTPAVELLLDDRIDDRGDLLGRRGRGLGAGGESVRGAQEHAKQPNASFHSHPATWRAIVAGWESNARTPKRRTARIPRRADARSDRECPRMSGRVRSR